MPLAGEPATAPAKRSKATLVISASSLGTMFEWYDFFLYGALAGEIARHYFSAVNETTGYIFALAAFSAGFIVRPLGALVFGRIGDLVGRKNTFLVTMTLMGAATFAVGLLPSYETIGIAAPIILIVLRLLQGLAVGGEYGGAAIYIAEHAPPGRRGFHTSWVQTTGCLGLVLSLSVILWARTALTPEAFAAWGWRIPFLVSILLLAISLWIRLKLNESPVFQAMKAAAATSRAPIAEAFGRWSNLKSVLIALALIAGQGVAFYTASFYVITFLDRVLRVEGAAANGLMILALLIGAPFYVLAGWLSDRLGRRPVILAGLALSGLLTIPLFYVLSDAANPALGEARAAAPVVVRADPGECSLQFDPIGRNRFDATSCDIAKSTLTRAGVAYANEPLAAGAAAEVGVGERTLVAPDPGDLDAAGRAAAATAFGAQLQAALAEAGYPARADRAAINAPLAVVVIALLVMAQTLAYGPQAALLVELFAARIRYTAMSVPYHIGQGWFGGFVPTIGFAVVAATGDAYAGLWYPVGVIAVSLAICLFALPETRGRAVGHEG